MAWTALPGLHVQQDVRGSALPYHVDSYLELQGAFVYKDVHVVPSLGPEQGIRLGEHAVPFVSLERLVSGHLHVCLFCHGPDANAAGCCSVNCLSMDLPPHPVILLEVGPARH